MNAFKADRDIWMERKGKGMVRIIAIIALVVLVVFLSASMYVVDETLASTGFGKPLNCMRSIWAARKQG